MMYFRPGSQVQQLVTLLSIAGEFPIRSLSLLGNVRVYSALIHRLTSLQTFCNPQTGTEMTCRLLTISGKGHARSIRLYKGALPILDWIGPEAYRYYMDAFWGHRFPGDAAHRERNHRVAQAVALCQRAGVETRPELLPKLQNQSIREMILRSPGFYPARDLKKVGDGLEMNKTMFTRMVGAVFSNGDCYAVYNTRDAVMKWSGMGEFKTLHSLIEIARLNAGIPEVNSALLIGQSEETALATLIESDKTRRFSFRFDTIYPHLYFLPMDDTGIRQLRLLLRPGWKEQLLEMLFDAETRSYDRGLFEYDACIDGVYILSHLDGDIARLVRFRDAIETQDGQFELLCYPHQAHFLQEYLGRRAAVKTISMDEIEKALGTEEDDI